MPDAGSLHRLQEQLEMLMQYIKSLRLSYIIFDYAESVTLYDKILNYDPIKIWHNEKTRFQ